MKILYRYKNIVNFYKENINYFGTTNKGIGWSSSKAKNLRYKTITEIIQKSKYKKKFHLLDFGCGLSGFFLYLEKKKITFKYSGIDTSLKIIKYCKKKFIHNKYYNFDILKNDKNIGKFDIVILNGIFTIKANLKDNEMYLYIFEILKTIKKKTKGLMIINFLTDEPDWKNEKNFYPCYDVLKKFIKQKISTKIDIIDLPQIFEKIIVIKLK